jgi:hypothetical protein
MIKQTTNQGGVIDQPVIFCSIANSRIYRNRVIRQTAQGSILLGLVGNMLQLEVMVNHKMVV